MCLEGGLMNTAEKSTTPDYPVNSESWWGDTVGDFIIRNYV